MHRSLQVPSRGIRAPREPSFDLNLHARPLTQVTRFSAASHATAFLIWDFPGYLPGMNAPGIHISRPDTMAIPRRRGAIGHVGQFFEDEITRLDGVLITTRTRTWLDCARKMSVDELTVVADHLLRHPRPAFEGRSEPYATPDQLTEMLDRHKGTPGIRKARLALEQARIGADSAPETRLRLALGRAGLPEPELNARTDCAPASSANRIWPIRSSGLRWNTREPGTRTRHRSFVILPRRRISALPVGFWSASPNDTWREMDGPPSSKSGVRSNGAAGSHSDWQLDRKSVV